MTLRFLYFGKIPVLDRDEARSGSVGPRLIVASHRNGAFDGHQVLAAFPHAQFLVSIQLLRHWFLRLLVAGIPVVRPKDVQRYKLDPSSVADPVQAGCAQLRRGGDLAVFPEGTSEWGHQPQRYQRGAARMACTMLSEGTQVEVVPVGLFYSTPDRFRSRAEVVRGGPVALPVQGDLSARDWEATVAQAIGEALDAVSVNCPDEETFRRIQAQALHLARRSKPRLASSRAVFARSFLQLQGDVAAGRVVLKSLDAAKAGRRTYAFWRWLGLLLMWVFAPVLGVAALAGARADARNTVTFFRMLGGFAAALIWGPVLVVLACFWPLVVGVGILSAILGWLLMGVRRIRL